MLTRLLISFTLLIPVFNAFCQSGKTPDEQFFSIWYDSLTSHESGYLMYNPVYLTAIRGRTTHQYFNERVWKSGTVTYAGQTYEQISLLLDLEEEQLVIKHPGGSRVDGIALDMKLLDNFAIDGHHFSRILNDNESSFFEILLDATHLRFVAKRKKKLTAENGEVEFKSLTIYYIQRGGTLTTLKGMKTMKKLYPSYKKAIQQLQSTEHLKINLRKEELSIRFLKRFDELLNGGQ